MTPENEEPGAQKAPRHRSPNYPGIGLKAAVEKITGLYKADGLVASPTDAAMKHMGGGDPGRVVSALKSFGLATEENERIKLTQRGIDIVARPAEDPKRKQAIKEAALGPTIYRDLLKEYTDVLPSDTTLRSELIAGKKFNPKAVDDFIRDFKATVEFAGISPSTAVDYKHEEEEHEPPPPLVTPAIGDYVQWESQGQLQFREPKQIKGFSEDGEWAFLEGSATGVPVKELTVSDPPADTPPPPPALKGKLGTPPPSPFPPGPTPGASAMRQDVFSLVEGPVTIQWPAALSGASFEDLSGWLDILKRKIGRSIDPRRQAQKDRIIQSVRKLHSAAIVKFEDHGPFIWFRVTSPDESTLLLPYSEDRDVEFYERLSEEELEERLHTLSNNRI